MFWLRAKQNYGISTPPPATLGAWVQNGGSRKERYVVINVGQDDKSFASTSSDCCEHAQCDVITPPFPRAEIMSLPYLVTACAV